MEYFTRAVSAAFLQDSTSTRAYIRRGLEVAPDFRPDDYRSGLVRLGYGFLFEAPEWETVRTVWEEELGEIN
jgi:hypothetical protein